jgi:hypothetical protein
MWLARGRRTGQRGLRELPVRTGFAQVRHIRWHGSTGKLGFSKGVIVFGRKHDLENALPCKAGHLIAQPSLHEDYPLGGRLQVE